MFLLGRLLKLLYRIVLFTAPPSRQSRAKLRHIRKYDWCWLGARLAISWSRSCHTGIPWVGWTRAENHLYSSCLVHCLGSHLDLSHLVPRSSPPLLRFSLFFRHFSRAGWPPPLWFWMRSRLQIVLHLRTLQLLNEYIFGISKRSYDPQKGECKPMFSRILRISFGVDYKMPAHFEPAAAASCLVS